MISGHQGVVSVGGGKNQETTETRVWPDGLRPQEGGPQDSLQECSLLCMRENSGTSHLEKGTKIY